MHKTRNAYWEEFVPKLWTLLRQQYSTSIFFQDLIAGVTVGVVALPLAMAFSIAVGLPPQNGLYTAIVAGFLISFLGGSRFQIGGPTGAFVAILAAILQHNGYNELVLITIMAGVILLIAAFSRLGSLIKYVPYPVVTGFTTGIAVIIFSTQVKDFLGLQISNVPADFIPKWIAIFSALPTLNFTTLALSSGTLLTIILIRRFIPVLPWGITAVILATCISWSLGLPVETIATRFGVIERALPSFSLPSLSIPLQDLHTLIPDAITVAFLAGIESLLSAVVADGMTGTRHRSNCELMAQGIANISSALFGGIPATGAIARTATNVKTGAKTPVAGMIHALTLLFIVLTLAPIVSQIPLAALSSVLIMVSWNMSEAERFRHLFKAPRGDVAVLLITFLLTVLIDLTVAIEVGMILALFVFMKRMSERSSITSLITLDEQYTADAATYDAEMIDRNTLPSGVEIYEITGPFFFGIADSLKMILASLSYPPRVFILRMRKVPMIDASGMYSLLEFHDKCQRGKTILFLSGVNPHLLHVLKNFGVVDKIGEKNIFKTIDAALQSVPSDEKHTT